MSEQDGQIEVRKRIRKDWREHPPGEKDPLVVKTPEKKKPEKED